MISVWKWLEEKIQGGGLAVSTGSVQKLQCAPKWDWNSFTMNNVHPPCQMCLLHVRFSWQMVGGGWRTFTEANSVSADGNNMQKRPSICYNGQKPSNGFRGSVPNFPEVRLMWNKHSCNSYRYMKTWETKHLLTSLFCGWVFSRVLSQD